MADTLTNIALPLGEYVNLYTSADIAVGVQIRVQNLGVADVYLTAQAAAPTTNSAYVILPRADSGTNDTGDAGAWAISNWSDGKVNVRIV